MYGRQPMDIRRLMSAGYIQTASAVYGHAIGQRERQKNESECNNVASEKLCCEIIN